MLQYICMKNKLFKKQNSSNKEIEQMFSGINMGSSVQFARPDAKKIWVNFFVVFILGLVLFFSFWFWRFTRPSLAKDLPDDVLFYAKVSIPYSETWSKKIFFWREKSNPGARGSRLYKKFDLINWEGVSFYNSIMPVLKNELELAITSQGSIVARSVLIDKDSWFSLVGYGFEYSGSVEKFESKIHGWWRDVFGFEEDFYWQIKGDIIYISSDEYFKTQFSKKGQRTIFDKLSSRGINSGVFFGYISDQDSVPILKDNKTAGAFFASLGEPFVFSVQKESDVQWNLRFEGQRDLDKSDTEFFKSFLPFKDGTSLVFFASDLGKFLENWQKVIYENQDISSQIFYVDSILKDFYSFDFNDFLGLVSGNGSFLAIENKGNNNLFDEASGWLLFIESLDIDSGIDKFLEDFGSSLFAISHPLTVERKLPDGSLMIELRAETQGIEWKDDILSYKENSLEMQSLLGQGEKFGYFKVYIPGSGYAFSNSLYFLEQYFDSIDNFKKPEFSSQSCVSAYTFGIGAVFSSEYLFDESFLNGIIEHILIGESWGNGVVGCVKFK